jgi:hypothetical protein
LQLLWLMPLIPHDSVCRDVAGGITAGSREVRRGRFRITAREPAEIHGTTIADHKGGDATGVKRRSARNKQKFKPSTKGNKSFFAKEGKSENDRRIAA